MMNVCPEKRQEAIDHVKRIAMAVKEDCDRLHADVKNWCFGYEPRFNMREFERTMDQMTLLARIYIDAAKITKEEIGEDLVKYLPEMVWQ